MHTRVAPRHVFCAIASSYQDREVADAACAGRFTNAGVTLELGREPDWLADVHPDEEWRIEWTKFYFGLDLAHAFAQTGDAKYLDTWVDLVRSFIARVPVGHDTSDVAARRVTNWLYAWDIFARVSAFPGLPDAFEAELVASIAAHARFIRANLTPERNHRTLELYALFVVGLAMPGCDADGDLLRFAIDALAADLDASFLPDGVHIEASTHYHMVVLRSFVALRENAVRHGLTLPDGFDEKLARACEFALHCHRPDGAIPAFSDADTGSYLDLLALAGALLERPDFTYVATRGNGGTPPGTTGATFPDGGYCIQRSGWGTGLTSFEDERFLMLDCGPIGAGGHGHYDALSVEIAAGGQPLVMDPGRYTYSEAGENFRRWFKSTAAHNTVCVDGIDQTPYRRGKPRGPVATTRLVRRLVTDGLDMIVAEVESPLYDARHQRRVIFVAGEYWIIEDRLRGEDAHDYTLRFHLPPVATDRLIVSGATALARDPGVAFVASPARPWTIESGWVAPRYGVKQKSPVLASSVRGRADATFVTVVMPLRGRAGPPRVSVRRSDDFTAIEVTGTGRAGASTDVVSWRCRPGCEDVQPGWRRRRTGGSVTRAGR